MSGADLPYQLRPSKFIDRQLFIECVARLSALCGLERYVYISMGGRLLTDFHAVYNRLGIDALYAFDKDSEVVARQRFNRPTGKTICATLNSADLPSKLDDILSGFRRKTNAIIWLDYTDSRRRSQFQEAVQVMSRLKHGDIFRITLNASITSLSKNWVAGSGIGPLEHNANTLRSQLQEFMPSSVTTVSDEQFPFVLASCFELATKQVEALESNVQILPTLITHYKDGQSMITLTCAVCERNSKHQFIPKTFSKWKFACRSWGDIRRVYAPLLSAKEQTQLDSTLHLSPKRMLRSLDCLVAKDEAQSLESLKSYRMYQRYYPSFRHVVE